jgi:phosphoribosyl 1,2-cyclic phosphate phosphodiesterase
MAFKISFLGTGTSQGVPLIACACKVCQSHDSKDKRLRSSIKIDYEGSVIVIDSGPDFRQQMLRTNTQRLDALLFTHEHKDHIAGMDDIRAFNYSLKQAIDVYAHVRVQEALKREFQYIFSDFKYPGVPEVNLHELKANQALSLCGLDILPIEVMHFKLPVLGFRVSDFTYITDANSISEASKDLIRGSKVLVLNALRHETHISHFTLDEAIALAHELQIPQVYLTHISHQLGLHEQVQATLPAGISLAYDGLEILMD